MKRNFETETVWVGDNLEIMRMMNGETVDLVYLDPPFNSNRQYANPIGTCFGRRDPRIIEMIRKGRANGGIDGKLARDKGGVFIKEAIGFFDDIWRMTDVKEEALQELKDCHPDAHRIVEAAAHAYGYDMKAFLIMMSVRLAEVHRILKPTGSVYLHCDPTASHYLKMVMDGIFGRQNFRNEIVWRKYGGRKNNAKSKFSTQNDTILFYAKSGKEAVFNVQYEPISQTEIDKKYTNTDADGRKYRLAWGRNYQVKGEQRKIYLEDQPGVAIGNLWVEGGLQLNTSSAERTGYPTQKPLALLERIIKASSNEGDIVFDPFCGCATSLVAARNLGREWLGMDLSPLAVILVEDRINGIRNGSGKTDPAMTGMKGYKAKHKDYLAGDRLKRTDIAKAPAPAEAKGRTAISDKIRRELYGEQEGECKACGEHMRLRHMHVDHKTPRSRGGMDVAANLQLLCGSCNSIKGNRSMQYLMDALFRKGIISEERYNGSIRRLL